MDNFAVKKVRLERLDVLNLFKNSSGIVFRSSIWLSEYCWLFFVLDFRYAIYPSIEGS